MTELLDVIMQGWWRRRWKLRIHSPVARWQAAALERLFPFLLRRPAPLTQLVMLEEENTGNPIPAETV
ncbi:MAG: hypothetical protein H7A45_06140 [Verrucomicrobiales bacterium]|nr:hypothetical protein [Verrucomicrobiales bacterium]